MIASLGYCLRRLGDISKSAIDRLKAFLDPQSLKRDMNKYYEILEDGTSVDCRSPHCDVLFDSVLELQYHYQDVHYIPVPRKRSTLKSEVNGDPGGIPQADGITSSGIEFPVSIVGSFKRKKANLSDLESKDALIKRHDRGTRHKQSGYSSSRSYEDGDT